MQTCGRWGGSTIFLGAMPLRGAGKAKTVGLPAAALLRSLLRSPWRPPAPALPWPALESVPTCREQTHPEILCKPWALQREPSVNCAAGKKAANWGRGSLMREQVAI